MKGTFAKIYLVVGSIILLGYLTAEARGMVFSGTDLQDRVASSGGGGSRTGRSTGGVGWFGGYHGGK
jgi:hypothetical protein